MTLIALGISHRSAPMAMLDRIGMTRDQVEGLAGDLCADEAISEAVVLATCNRLEVYADVARFHPAVTVVSDLVAKWTGADRGDLSEHSYVHFDTAAVAHLFAVAAGLDSMVVGEGQILGQIRAALASGQESGTAGRALNSVVQGALRVGKRVRSETGIDRSGASVVSVALDRAEELLGTLDDRRVLVVGAGSMGALAVSALTGRGVSQTVVASRTEQRAARLAASAPNGRVALLDDVPTELASADVAVFCTGALGAVLAADDLRAVRDGDSRALVLLDLALPHDVDPGVTTLPGVTLIDLAALSGCAATAAPEQDVAAARLIVDEEVEAFQASAAATQVEPILVSLRTHAGSVLDAELDRLRLRLTGVDATTIAEVERALRRAVNTLLHNPTVRMKQLAAEPGGGRYAEALSALFDLDPGLPAAVLDPAARADDDGGRA